MKTSLPAWWAGLAALALACSAQAQSKLDLNFSGFATVGATHSDDERADFAATRIQPNGAGRTRQVSLSTDTRVGAQMNLRLDQQFELVAQVVAQHQYDNSFRPAVEWLNLGYKVNESLSVRLGRTALPVYLIADSRHVGYGMPWVRVPSEVYGTFPITSNDGIDMIWRTRGGGLNNTLQLFAGRTALKVPIGEATSRPTMGLANTVEFGHWTLRGSLARYRYNASAGSLDFEAEADRLIDFAASVPLPAFQQAAQDGRALKERFRLTDRTLSIGALGVAYDPGPYFLSAEAVALSGGGYLASSRAWYASGGLRLGAWTPYATYARTHPSIEPAAYVTETGLVEFDQTTRQAVDALNYGLRILNADQASVALGLRWDLERNLALKAQWERIQLGPQSIGRFINNQPGFEGSRVNLFSVSADYVF